MISSLDVRQHHGRLARLVLVGGLVISGCGEEPQQAPPIRPVRTAKVFATGGNRVRSFAGAAQAAVEAPLSFRVGGTVLRIPVSVGNAISRGQLIAQLNSENYDLQLQDARASLRQAQANLRNADANYGRVRALYENNNASANDLDAARTSFEAATAQVQSLENRVSQAELSVQYTRLIAPRSGSIASVNVDANQNVQAGQTIVVMTSGDELEVHVAVPEILITGVEVGSVVNVQFDALPGRQLPARVTEVGVTTSGFATTYPVTVRLTEPNPDIRAGMAAEVFFNFRASNDAQERFYVPAIAIGEDRDGRFAWVVERTGELDQGIVRRRPVLVGELTSDGLEILEGLADGEEIVTAGVSKVTDGLTVRLPAPASSPQ